MEEATQLSVERLESQLNKVARTMEEDAAANIGMQYALVIDGKALLYALSPRLRQQFLMVRGCCCAGAGHWTSGSMLCTVAALHLDMLRTEYQGAQHESHVYMILVSPNSNSLQHQCICMTKLPAAASLQVGIKCAAVLCCRVSPLQKAQVTALVKTWGDTTLAIGDGANDVGMIQKAHIGESPVLNELWHSPVHSCCHCQCLGHVLLQLCQLLASMVQAPSIFNSQFCSSVVNLLCPAGVGISGQEGMQATMASDFAIAQFRFLTPLLLVHGRLSYKRITRMISFFFYKNLFYGSTIFIYNAFALFSGQPIYNDFYMTLFNVVFTAAAPLVVGWFDRDLDKDLGLRFPFLYHEGEQPGRVVVPAQQLQHHSALLLCASCSLQ